MSAHDPHNLLARSDYAPGNDTDAVFDPNGYLAARREAMAIEAELLERELAYRRLQVFTERCTPGFLDGWHIREIAAAVEQIEQQIQSGTGTKARLIVEAPPRHGKALAFGSLVPTRHGMVKIEDLQPGDSVIGSDGKPTQVLAKRVWRDRPRYRVTTDDGHSVVVDANHEWEVRLDRKRKAFTIRTTEWLANRTNPRKPLVRMVKTVGEWNYLLPVAPYTLGVWLGDGTSSDGSVTLNADDAEQFVRHIEADGYEMRKQAKHLGWGVLGLVKQLRAADLLNNKHIPEEYFGANHYQRLALLQGLIDTDGYVAPHGQVEFCSTNERLARDTARLVHSLGVKASVCEGRATVDGKDCGPKYRVMFYMDSCARIDRKRANTKDGTKQPGRYLSFEKVENGDTCCIEVAAEDHLYLCSDAYILTHNSQIISRCTPLWYLGRHPDHEIIVATYAQDLADDLGRWAKLALTDPGIQAVFPKLKIRSDSRAANRLDTTKGGGIRYVGAGGPITGRGAHLAIIDDPIKGAEDADSETQSKALWDWYTSVLRTRLAPGGGIIVLHTRWRVNDLIGRLVEKAEAGEGEQFKRITFSAKAQRNDPWGREEGEPLHPERYTKEDLDALQMSLPPRDWLALYQQCPMLEEGNIFKVTDFNLYRPGCTPRDINWYISTDYGVSTKESDDPSCIWPFGVDPDGVIHWAPDFVYGHMNSLESVRKTVQLAKQYKVNAMIIEGGQIWRALEPLFKQEMRKQNYFCQIINPPPVKDKYTRSRASHGRMSAATMLFPDTRRIREMVIPEFLVFTGINDDHDEFVDTVAWAGHCSEQMILPVKGQYDEENPEDEDIVPGSYADLLRRCPIEEPDRRKHSPERLKGGQRRRGTRFRYA